MDLGAFTATILMLVVVALVFDFMNGFHDAANSIATVVSTG
jgi:PiT family inorganic phosphate transporter